MPITSIRRDWGVAPSSVRITSTDSLSAVQASGYMKAQIPVMTALNGGPFSFVAGDVVMMAASDGDQIFSFVGTNFNTLVPTAGGSGGDVTPIQIQEATFISGTDSGIADAYVVTLEPSASFTANNGSAFSFSPLNNNATTSPTVSVNGSAPLPIVLPNNTAVQANDIATGSVAPYLIYSNGVWLLMNALVSGGGGGGVTSTQVQQSAFNVGLDSGIADAYSVTLSPTVTSYTNGLWVLFNPVNANATGTPTLSVNGLGAMQISNTFGGQLYPFDLNPGFIAVCFYCAFENSFILVNPISSGVQLGNIQNNNYTGVSDSGTTNAYVMTLAPAPASIPNAGINYTLQYAANANTGASTLTINGTIFDIVTPNYSPLIGGEILVNGSYNFLTSYNGVAFVAILLNSSLS